ncbi:uncharacterized protein (DUF1800 family) [Oxalobacteraceae bacterium GrIS 1.11]
MNFVHLRAVLAVTSISLLAACGSGGGGGSSSANSATIASDAPVTMTAPQAARFLTQASFGPTSATIAQVADSGARAWITAEFAKPQTLHRDYMNRIAATLPVGGGLSQNQVYESFWQQAALGDDQLRQRMTFALSQIFVISMQDNTVGGSPRGSASYYDMLGSNAFGNFRQLLEGVALHPMMGQYLSHLHNQKESGTRVPDENFAREVMQLFTIGLYQLNPDGSLKLNAGQPVETYQHDDVSGLAKVFTGWSWAGPDKSPGRFVGVTADADRDWKPMQNYPNYHSVSKKDFLGASIPASTTGEADLKTALDTLFQHPNVGPFIGRQLIQRLVTSNPSPAYVGRVAAAFADNGAGVRGDMKALISAILLDPEARGPGPQQKLREPVIRLANWMRAFNATSSSGRYLIANLDDPLMALGQTVLRSPSVFNFYRPAYVPPNTAIAAAGLVAPEMQITAEPSVIGYLNFMQDTIGHGLGLNLDVKSDYAAELALVDQPEQLVARVNLLLLNGAMSSTLQGQILAAVNAVVQPVPTKLNATAVANAKRQRVCLAIFLAMAGPEYIVQK